MKADLFVQYRDAGGAEIVVERLNLDEPMKLVRTASSGTTISAA